MKGVIVNRDAQEKLAIVAQNGWMSDRSVGCGSVASGPRPKVTISSLA